MADEMPVDIEVTLRHVEPVAAVKEQVLKKLGRAIRSMPNVRTASVEITFEHARPAAERYVLQITLTANGALLRVEDRGPQIFSILNNVHDLLERRIRDWKGRVYFQKRREASAYRETVQAEAARRQPEDQPSLIVRKKSHDIKPMFPEDAIEHMELLDHSFFFFFNAESSQYNVIYRRKAGGYGLIEPVMVDTRKAQ